MLTALLSLFLFNNGWSFHLGDAASMSEDFAHGTQYFTHMAKYRSWSGIDATSLEFAQDSSWTTVNLPHDWVVDLPYSSEASHSHGYKCIGWKYPQNSVGWYRKEFEVPASDKGKVVTVEFEGIFRSSEIYINGVYIGHERSGYASRWYDLSDYLRYGERNVIAVRVDASLEEGWYYEGAGIYRNVWLRVSDGPVAIRPHSLRINGTEVGCDYVCMPGIDRGSISSRVRWFDATGREVARLTRPWSLEDPYLYTVQVDIYYNGELSDSVSEKYGVRTTSFDPEQGFLLNGSKVFLKGANVHLDAAGVGVGVPDELWRWRIARLKEFGFNAIRTAHNPASPSMLRVCDEMGVLVLEEVRQYGAYPEALELLRNMIERDRNHPCVIAWGMGNEEWGVQGDGTAVTRRAVEYAHELDPLRPTTYGNSGGEYLIDDEVDVPGYNYIRQNRVDQDHAAHPSRSAIGTEETTGGGVRGARGEFDIDYVATGYQFYVERPWTAGLFFWTGFDYRGEPNPKVWPNTGSLFGLLDYCGYPKEEMWELRGLWSGETKRELKAARQSEDPNYRLRHFSRRPFVPRPVVSGNKSVVLQAHKPELQRDGQDVIVVDVFSEAASLEVSVEGAELLGWGNGDPQFQHVERPAPGRADGSSARNPQTLTIYPFVGRAQVIIRSIEGSSCPVTLTVGSASLNF